MGKISVIGTTHKEGGLCTSDELCKILENISPEIIFLEVPPEKFTQVFEGQIPDILETSAVKKYLIDHQSEHIPVDPKGLHSRERYQKMINTFNNNPEYDRVSLEYDYLGQNYGFKFLNSIKADQMQDYLHFLESDIVRIGGNQEFSNVYEKWRAINDKRENHWIDTIHGCYERNNISNAVFLVGSAHRIRLMEKVKNLQEKGELNPQWDFFPFKDLS